MSRVADAKDLFIVGKGERGGRRGCLAERRVQGEWRNADQCQVPPIRQLLRSADIRIQF